ncbi:2,4-dihydroxyhept-2-ene-1,7-dioic acid aldolase [Pseudomonas sp. HAR-UPW-AIA-41]|uniref:DUF2218 domain-containing protein n=1 Tax=Pseudomonas sp. HAR-UPW-AIA-41 TaxID=1985301 RepID=UPI000BB3409C|nr:DUF2218 domain-containing protein [Pseudomonas sp. HAR-UPW-AIA-41]PAV48039.1 2,4-dihydroxyhept-2-ene-1,7-dioic acid aldolase [Pseudomonas sp. HAR-UPW-AIA-41]
MHQFNSSAFVATHSPTRYIRRLCQHFAHKIPVNFNDQQGQLDFNCGQAWLTAEEQGLTLTVSSRDAGDLNKLQEIVASHFERFAWQESLQLEWRTPAV